MTPRKGLNRRQFAIRGLQLLGASLLAGCDALSQSDWFASMLARVGVKTAARYVVVHCFDALKEGGDKYYESLDLEDALHEQTILAYDLNDERLPLTNGAPLRLRIERQLGYKAAKYVRRIELVEGFDAIGRGKGGYWEDRGYVWYAGI